MNSRIDILQHHQLSGSYQLFSLNCMSCKIFHNIEKIVLHIFCLSFLHLHFKGNLLSGPCFHKIFNTLILTTTFTVNEITIVPRYILQNCGKQNCKVCQEVKKLSTPSPCVKTRLTMSVIILTNMCLIWPLKSPGVDIPQPPKSICSIS